MDRRDRVEAQIEMILQMSQDFKPAAPNLSFTFGKLTDEQAARLAKLDALEEAGVVNWEGYADAMGNVAEFDADDEGDDE